MGDHAGEALEIAAFCADLEVAPEAGLLEKALEEASEVLAGEEDSARPRSVSGLPGGIVKVSVPLVLVLPDIHARPRLLLVLLRSSLPGTKTSVAAALASGELELLCLGDVPHSEGPQAAGRWILAAERALRSWAGGPGVQGPEMEAEMASTLGALLCVLRLQVLFPGRFRCLKGNHDNLGNRADGGDSPFFKYSSEGLLTAEWLSMRYGPAFLELARGYEVLLPLLAEGGAFCASHAEPAFALSPKDLADYRLRPDVVRSLIWTRDGEAEAGALGACLDAFLGPGKGKRYWIAGHRPVARGWRLRVDGLVQIHDPSRAQVLLVRQPGRGSAHLALCRIEAGGGLVPEAEIGPQP